jgi:hypothetical protein
VPIKNPIGSLKRGGTKFLISKDSSGNFKGSFMFYVADSLYDLATKGVYSPATFTGAAVYTDLVGKVQHGYKVVDGQSVGTADAKLIRGNGQSSSFNGRLKVRSCWSETIGITMPDYAFSALGYESIEVIKCDGFGGSSAGAGSSGGGWDSGVPSNVFTDAEKQQLRTKLRALGLNELEDYFLNDKELCKASEAFLNARGKNNINNNALFNLVPAAVDVALFSSHMDLLSKDNKYYNANKNASFPNIGSDAWRNTLKFTITSPTNGLDIYDVTFPNSVKTKDAIFARAFAQDAAEHIDKIFDTALIHVDNIINPLECVTKSGQRI